MAAQEAASTRRITFTKILKGSSPEYLAISVDDGGKGTYDSHKLDEQATPRPLQISADTTQQIFSLAESLNHLQSSDLESRHKVANMGLKTLTYEAGKERHQVQYNYTENRPAQQLTALFEKISNVEEHIVQLEYEMKYDHLNLPQTLALVQGDMAEHNLVEPALLLPTLEKISNNPRFMHLAKSRAEQIMSSIKEHK